MKKLLCCPALELFSCLPLWKTVRLHGKKLQNATNVLTRPIKSLCTLFSLFLFFELWPELLNSIQKMFGIFYLKLSLVLLQVKKCFVLVQFFWPNQKLNCISCPPITFCAGNFFLHILIHFAK